MSGSGAIEARRSAIEGTGVFARREFAAGGLIGRFRFDREITATAPLRDDERVEHCAYPDDRVMLVAAPERHVNHSCDPNAYERHHAGRIEIVARREIAEGEEITVDYLINNSRGDSWPCHCGADRCRGETGTSYFELPIEFRTEYRPLLAGWFVRRHEGRLAED